MLRAVARVLDTGCGSGRNLVYFLREGYEVFGVDTDPNAIECTRGLAASLAPALPADNFRVEAIEEMTFPDAFADLVLTSAVLHFARRDDHFEAMLRATWRVLKPGGLFFCRLASSIGMEHQVQRVSGRRFRSEVSFRCSIQRESCTSGANARSASVVGNGPGSSGQIGRAQDLPFGRAAPGPSATKVRVPVPTRPCAAPCVARRALPWWYANCLLQRRAQCRSVPPA